MKLASLTLPALVAGGLLGRVAAAEPSQRRPDSRRECAACHLQWMEGFSAPEAVLLIDRPTEALVAESDTCLGCHDGSVGDSRRRVWAEHGHKQGIEPPANMNVPRLLPLKDGKITCRTCHTAHAGPDQETLAATVTLRARNDAGQLCQMCHLQHAKGPELGTHPTGGMPWPVPDELIAAGAKVGPSPSRLTCQTCHTPHGEREQYLLVMGARSSRLCLACHAKLRPAIWRADALHEHPQNPTLSTDEQRQAIKEMDTKLGPGQTLICLSCHKLHHGLASRDMLADTLADSALCLRCHPQHREMFGSKHDLRLSAPAERNRLGRTAAQAGPCGACHSFHQRARRPEPNEIDETGLCTTCHRPGQCAEKATGLPFSHPPEADCLTCHDPHRTRHGRFLRQEPDSLCGDCHDEKAESLAGAHDFTNHPTAKNGRGRTARETGKCGFCHGVHNANGSVLWVATDKTPESPDDFCIQCHRPGGLAAAKPVTRYRHPTGPATAAAAKELGGELPLFSDNGRWAEDGFVACASCHDPHADPDQSPRLLRVEPPVSALCTTCHSDKAALAKGSHDSTVAGERWPEPAGKRKDMCLACHQPHGNDPAHQLWTMAPAEADEPADGVCFGCHPNAAWHTGDAPPKLGAALHPEVGCTTCHNPHARADGPPHFLRGEDPADPAAVCADCHEHAETIPASMHSPRALRAYAPDVCGPCHAVHARESSLVERLWAGPAAVGRTPPGTERCLGCHGPGGRATRITRFDHPAVLLQNVSPEDTAGFMPLVDAEGTPGERGRMACGTCHLPHGREADAGFPEIDPAAVGLERLRYVLPMVRPYVAPALCGTCHGYDGLRRFLYFHNRERIHSVRATQNAASPQRVSESSTGRQ